MALAQHDYEWIFSDPQLLAADMSACSSPTPCSNRSADEWSILEGVDEFTEHLEQYGDGTLASMTLNTEENVHPEELRSIERAIIASMSGTHPISTPGLRSNSPRRQSVEAEVPSHYKRARVATKDTRILRRFQRPDQDNVIIRFNDSRSISTTHNTSSILSNGATKRSEVSDPSAKAQATSSKSNSLENMEAKLIGEVTRHLCFPDIFALAMSCRSVSSHINLPKAKAEYYEILCDARQNTNRQSYSVGSSLISRQDKDFCNVCLYSLEQYYFRGCTSTPKSEPRICSDCADMRARVLREKLMPKTEAQMVKGHGCIEPVWRPSERVWVDSNKESLWYRDRP